MAEDGAGTTGEDGPELERPVGGSTMSEQVDAAMKWVESRAPDPAIDHLRPDAGTEQLRPRDHAVLIAGDLDDNRGSALAITTLSHFAVHTTGNPGATVGATSLPQLSA